MQLMGMTECRRNQHSEAKKRGWESVNFISRIRQEFCEAGAAGIEREHPARQLLGS